MLPYDNIIGSSPHANHFAGFFCKIFKILKEFNKLMALILEHKHNFRKYSSSHIDSLGSPYDYDSIMHYGRDAFSRWPFQTTIRVKESGASIGQRDHISTQDAWQINKHYGCSIKNQ